MRVYEFAKEANVSSKEILEWLAQHGHDLSSHMAVLPDEAFELLVSSFGKEAKPATQEKVVEKPVTQKPLEKVTTLADEALAKSAQEDEKAKMQQPTMRPQGPHPKKIIPQGVMLVDMPLGELARQVGHPVSEIIITLLGRGIVCNINQIVPKEIVADIARSYELELIEPKKDKKAVVEEIPVTIEKKEERPPVIVVMGHVDHGKTSLLDFIRKTRVAAREKGGITQHIGAYDVSTPQGNLVFLDTPGHEAFSRIRARGAKVADIAILIVAADDGIMPQTVEAIHHAKAMNVPIIVAINKVDKVDSGRIDIVRQQLTEHELVPEEWGGQTIIVPISAKTGQGVDKLLEMLSLQSEMMELGADKAARAQGYVLESKLEKGRGSVATIICQTGTVHVGDYFICGNTYGKVNSLVDSHGKRIKQAGPSIPVQVAGFDSIADVGDTFRVVSLQEYKKIKQAGGPKPVSKGRPMGAQDTIALIVKADTHSSIEALIGSIEKVSKKEEKSFQILHTAVGDVNESDVLLASTTGGIIVGFHVKTDPKASSLAQKEGIQIRHFNIIYKLLENLQDYLKSKEEVKMVHEKTGEALVLKVFDIKKVGVIAGCKVQEGKFVRNGYVIVWRGKHKIGEGKINSLQRDRKAVKEVNTGYECAFMVDGVTDFAVDDRIECFIEKPEKK